MIPFEQLFFGALFLAGAAFLVYKALRHIRLRGRIARWRRVDGIVVEHAMIGRPGHYRPQFVVEYSDGNQSVRSTCDSPIGAGFSNAVSARRSLGRRPVGSAVTLWVNPKKRTRAYLELPQLYIIAAEFAAAIVLLGVLAVMFARN